MADFTKSDTDSSEMSEHEVINRVLARLIERVEEVTDKPDPHRYLPQIVAETCHWPQVWLFVCKNDEYLLSARWPADNASSSPTPRLSREILLQLQTAAMYATLIAANSLSRLLHLPENTPLLLVRGNQKPDFCLVVALYDASDSARSRALLQTLLPFLNLTLHQMLLLDETRREMETFQRLDREIGEHIETDRIFEMTLDWAIRYTNAHAGALLRYAPVQKTLQVAAELGYPQPNIFSTWLREQPDATPIRSMNQHRPLLIEDLRSNPAASPCPLVMRTHLSVPIRHDGAVIGVISLESRRVNAFNMHHLAFLNRLAARAAVSLSHAHLYSQAALERSKLAIILADTADVVVVVNEDNQLMLVSESARAVFSLPFEQAITGEPFQAVFAHTALAAAFARAHQNDARTIQEVSLADGRVYHAQFSRQSGIGWIIVMHDITPLKAIDQAKNDLLDTVSHDLKHPLQSIRGYIDLLMILYPDLFAEGQAKLFVEKALHSVADMRDLLDDFVEFAKSENGLQLEIEVVSIHDIVGECAANLLPLASQREIVVQLDFAADLPFIEADAARLRQIFTNLISNAIKYTRPSGTVWISAVALGESVTVTVRDDGIGISPEDQAHVFDRFFRVRRLETENVEGTGLGLGIVKRMVEAHHAQIGMESRLGEGSTFTVRLPLRQPTS